ncbi:MAG: Mth938-like domain-containing protein [Boseongicola sp.]
MRLNEVVFTEALPVEGYGPGFFRLGGQIHEAPLAVLPTGVTTWSGLDETELLINSANSIDLLIVGTGSEIGNIPAPFRETLENAGIGVEHMASPQACRTYNVLLGEGRRVALAVLPVT